MDKLIVANLKMNLNFEQIKEYKKIIGESDIKNFILCPSYIYLNYMKSNSYEVCSQNGYYKDEGACTGEISFYQLNKLGIKYSLIGHSERRHVFNESNDLISLKMENCIKNNVTPILCVGETEEDKNKGLTNEVIDTQINTALSKVKLSDVIIAYEPVWAIGTGLTPTIDDINNIHLHIKEMLKSVHNIESKVLYGGSVKLNNIKEIIENQNVDGVLIGSASNDPNNLLNMYNEVK